MHEVDKLIAGLEILKKYKPTMSVYGVTRARDNVELQEEEFGDITEEDKARLAQLSWKTNGHYVWTF